MRQARQCRAKTVHVLDPWDQCGKGQTASLNVLETLTQANPNYVDDARGWPMR